jgi:uncharacterized protein (DUF58 family)
VTPLEQLLAEELPTGLFGGAPARPREIPPGEQSLHRTQLLAALAGTTDHRAARRHLRAVPPPTAA